MKVWIDSEEIAAKPGSSLFELADQRGIRLPSSCGGVGNCRECLLQVTKGEQHLSARSPEEKPLRDQFRLACRARIQGGAGKIVCHSLKRSTMRIELSGSWIRKRELNPAVKRLGEAVLLDGNPIDRWRGKLHGLAIDVGTTTVVVRLVELTGGEVVASQAFENPQLFAGSDVMSRIRWDGENRGQVLRKVLLGYINHTIQKFPCDSMTIYEVVVVGNTTMRDLFFGLDLQGIGVKPFQSVTEKSVLQGASLGTALSLESQPGMLAIHPEARIYGLPLIGSHVGADTAACLLSIDFSDLSKPILLIDIGTNTEVVVGTGKRALSASCPAGPAFEGGGISCGMPALEGAIESVRVESAGGVKVSVIGDRKPEGICGSGLVDLLAELRRVGVVDDRGRFAEGKSSFVVDSHAEVFLTGQDISNLAQAKAANAAGLSLLTRKYGLDYSAIENFYLCGAFGQHLDLRSAQRIGLLPSLPSEKFVQLGNSAIEGATIALLSIEKRKAVESLVSRIEHVELETEPDFFNSFVDGLFFLPFGNPKPDIT